MAAIKTRALIFHHFLDSGTKVRISAIRNVRVTMSIVQESCSDKSDGRESALHYECVHSLESPAARVSLPEIHRKLHAEHIVVVYSVSIDQD